MPSPEALRPRTPSGVSSASGTSGAPAEARLLQDRLRLFGALAFLIAAAFYLAGQVLPMEARFGPEGHAAMWTVLLLTGGTALYCRGANRSLRTLKALDAVLMALLGVVLLLTPGGTLPEVDVRVMVVLLEVVLVVFTRSIFVPSTARRTLAVSVAAALPFAIWLVVNPWRHRIWAFVWLLSAIGVASAGSAVIYGLRREVRHARQLGQYTLEEKLGEGGMGVVFRARHAMLRRPTAVKLLRPERVGEASLRRFEREVQLTALLSHPNTVSVFDYGRTPDGVFYYAMEYLDGLTLEQLVAHDGAQRPSRVAHVVHQVLGALGEAHAVGLVHRDVKPSNVILCERGGIPDVAKVLDFGLVKDAEGDPGLSHETALVGTPLFLAPEAIRNGEAGPRSDVYAVGAVAYYLLTGAHVFEGRTVVEVCGHHLHTRPRPPSERLGRPLPAALEAWVLACLEKDPERRPSSAMDAAARLDACTLHDRWTTDEAHEWWERRGRAIGSSLRASVSPSADTLSRSFVAVRDGQDGASFNITP